MVEFRFLVALQYLPYTKKSLEWQIREFKNNVAGMDDYLNAFAFLRLRIEPNRLSGILKMTTQLLNNLNIPL